jgi:hypothetical protein
MASPPEIQKLLDRLEAAYKKLGEANPFKNFNASAFNDINDAISILNNGLSSVDEKLSYIDDDLSKISAGFKSIVDSLKTQNQALNLTTRSYNSLSSLAQKLKNDQNGISELNKKDLENLKKKAYQERENLVTAQNILKTKGTLDSKETIALDEINSLLGEQDGLFQSLITNANVRISQEEEINKKLGITPRLLGGIGKAMKSIGLPDFGLDKALEDTKSILRGEKDRVTVGKALNTYGSQLSNNLKSQLTTSNILQFVIVQLVNALKNADNQTGQLAKAFGTSYSEAASLRNELNTVANLSGDVNITTGALQESLIAVNKEFGTATMFSGELLKDFTNMTKVMGYTNEAAAKLSKITVATGTDLSDNTAQILGTAAAFNVTNGLALNEKEIVEGVAKASAATTVSLGMQPGKIAAAVVQAKALGLELEQVEGIAESLLNFESSISNELEAELLTGRALNLEQARYLALTNDIEGVAKEIAKQGITAAEFGGMNMIQQKAIAEAVGMTREELAQSLINQQALTNLGNKDKTLAEAYNRLKKEGLSDAQIQKQLGEDISAEQLKSQSIQERFNASVEKLQEIFVSLAEPILQIVSPFMDLVTTILPLINVILQPTVNLLKSLGAIITTNLSEPLKAMKETFSGIIDIFKGDFEKGLIKIGSGLLRSIMAPFQAVLNGITTFINGLIDMINAIPGVDIKSLNSIDLTTTIIDSMKDGKIDYQKGVVVSGGFGSVQLNEKDTFVGDKNGIKAGTNLFGNTAQSTSPSISVDIAPLVNEMQAVKAVLVQMLNKDTNVYLDGAQVGKGINMARTKIG